jgi:exodeoxyribonuclease X
MRKIFIADTETASIDGGICDLALIQVDEEFNELGRMEQLLDPLRPILPAAQEVHGITNSDVADQPTAAEFREIYGNPLAIGPGDELIIFAHKAAFDTARLEEDGFLVKPYTAVCTLRLARNLWPDVEDIGGNHKLGTLAIINNIPRGTAHRAMGDCETLLGLLRHITSVNQYDSFDHFVQTALAPLSGETKISFGKHRGWKLKDLPRSYASWICAQSDMDQDLQAALRAIFNFTTP